LRLAKREPSQSSDNVQPESASEDAGRSVVAVKEEFKMEEDRKSSAGSAVEGKTSSSAGLGSSDDASVVSKSVWMIVLKAVFEHFELGGPHQWLSGLRILSSVLPLPLPMKVISLIDFSFTLFVLRFNSRCRFVKTVECG
jgi:hypothetical protein